MDDEAALEVYRPLQFDGSLPPGPVEEVNIFPDSSLPSCEGDDSQRLMPSPAHDDDVGGAALDVTPLDEEMSGADAVSAEEEGDVLESSRSGVGKRKSGKKGPRAQSKPQAKKNTEEDVCFICFDGGNLVLCDRRFCPKAYHPTCVDRDEAFFRKKGRWNCGWHLCSICEKAAHFMCYTCTYSLCKGCIKKAVFYCVRSNKGLCVSCMRLVTLIEDNDARKEPVEVDFDDKGSWEYLFKEYWLDVKQKLCLTSVEITHASNPYNGSGVPAHAVASSDDELNNTNNDMNSSFHNSSGRLEMGKSASKRQMKRRRTNAAEEMTLSMPPDIPADGVSEPNDSKEWASKELLDFVLHMGGGQSVLSVFEVQSLLMDYVTKYKLRDPRKKSQIICDARLQSLFGKARVGHFEMLKLIESHVLVKETSSLVPVNQMVGRISDDETAEIEVEGSTIGKTGSTKKRKTKKKTEENTVQNNLNEYAAVDVHNISLIYLRRNLVEDLLDDLEKLQDKIVGSFVRIRIPGSGNKQDMYRLVQVLGTNRASEAYKTGRKSTDLMLEILNLNKTETVTIDSISNQEFSEEECKRLRQSIKCGFISRLTVGEIQEKAKVLQHVKVNDWFETELLRLSHLRDRASEKGRRKELRECVEKIQALSDPDERVRRLQEVPEVHADPNMDPNYESEEKEAEPENQKRENYSRPKDTGYSRRGWDAISPRKGSANDAMEGSRKSLNSSWERNKNSSAWGEPRMEKSQKSINDNGGTQSKSSYTHPGDQAGQRTSNALWHQASDRPSAGLPENRLLPQTVSVIASAGTSETDKMWHYCDPSGKIQGPFSMVQLRKWSTTGYFPADLRIWRASERQDDSTLLADALMGKFQKEASQVELKGSYAQTENINKVGNWDISHDRGPSGNNSTVWTNDAHSDGNRKSSTDGAEAMRNNGRESQSTSWTSSSMETLGLKGGHAGSSFPNWDPSKVSSTWSNECLGHGPGLSSSYGVSFRKSTESQGGSSAGRWNQSENNPWNTSRSLELQSGTWNTSHGYDNHLDTSAASSQLPGGGLKVHRVNITLKESTRPTSLASPTPAESQGAVLTGGRDWSDLPTPTPKSAGGGWSTSESKTTCDREVFIQPMSPVNSLEQPSAASTQPTIRLTASDGPIPASGTSTLPGSDSAHSMLAPTHMGGVGSITKDSGIVSSGSVPEPPTDVYVEKNPCVASVANQSILSADVCPSHHALLNLVNAGKGLADQTSHDSQYNGSTSVSSGMSSEYVEKVQADSCMDTSVVVESLMGKLDSQENVTSSSVSPAVFTRSDLASEHIEMGATDSLPKAVATTESLLVNQDLASSQFNPEDDSTSKNGVADNMENGALGSHGSQPVSEFVSKVALAEMVQDPDPSLPSFGSTLLVDAYKRIWSQASPSVSVKDSIQTDSWAVHGGLESNASVSGALNKSAACPESRSSEMISQAISSTTTTNRTAVSSHVPDTQGLSQAAVTQVTFSSDKWFPSLVSTCGQATNLISHSFSVYEQDAVGSRVSTSAAGSASMSSVAKGVHDFPAPGSSPTLVSTGRRGSATGGWGNIPSTNSEGLHTLAWDFPVPATTTSPVAPSDNWGVPTYRNSDNNYDLPTAAVAKNSSSWVANPSESNRASTASDSWAASSRNIAVSTDKWGQPPSDTSWRSGGQAEPSVSRGRGWGQPMESAKVGWNPQPGNMNARWGMESGNPRGGWDQQRQVSDRFSSLGGRGGYGGQIHDGNSRSRPMGGGNGSSGRSRPPRGQKVCRFHENGYCKKGASCDFLHP